MVGKLEGGKSPVRVEGFYFLPNYLLTNHLIPNYSLII